MTIMGLMFRMEAVKVPLHVPTFIEMTPTTPLSLLVQTVGMCTYYTIYIIFAFSVTSNFLLSLLSCLFPASVMVRASNTEVQALVLGLGELLFDAAKLLHSCFYLIIS